VFGGKASGGGGGEGCGTRGKVGISVWGGGAKNAADRSLRICLQAVARGMMLAHVICRALNVG